ncbi:DUF2795 domain-containing protein [Uliginosibacterium sp. H3]|uniref:DUF2795 domain-containing protein n=1 Tax=Uliginosibacterium silvisoli TaxID=3114758 RepID=A0ABU6K130_9RHOO|nr:DUF2795 domain-containing protein [Uliginosibacterium sp. H3]
MGRALAIDIQKYIKDLDYPATRDDVLRMAEKSGADEEMREALKSLPRVDFETPAEVSAALSAETGA